jgi:WD40 repeat protein
MRQHIIRAGLGCLILTAGIGLAACGGIERISFGSKTALAIESSEFAITRDNLNEIELLATYSTGTEGIVSGEFSPTEASIAVMSNDGVAHFLDLTTGAPTHESINHLEVGYALAYSPDGSHVVSGGRAGGQDIFVWDLNRNRASATIATTGYQIFDADWSPDGKRFVVVSRGASRFFIYDAEGTRLTQRKPSAIWLWSVDHGSDKVAISNEIGVTYTYDSRFYDLLWRSPVPDERTPSYDLDFSRDERFLANCYGNGKVSIWNVVDYSLRFAIDAHWHEDFRNLGCRDGAFTWHGDLYFTVGVDGMLHAWDMESGELLFTRIYDQELGMVSVSPDGELLAVGLQDGSVELLGLPEVFAVAEE